LTGGSFCYLLKSRPAKGKSLKRLLLVFFLPEELLKYVVHDPNADGGTRYRPANPASRYAGFFV